MNSNKLYSEEMKLSDFVENHSKQLPAIICTITGHYGNNIMQDMSANQILFARSVKSEQRMMTKRVDGSHISFPINFPTPFMFVEDNHKSHKETDVGALMNQSLHMEKQKVRLAGEPGSLFSVGGSALTSEKVGVLEFVKSYRENYLIVHRIINNESAYRLDKKALAIPTYLNLSLRVLYGQDGVPPAKWKRQIASSQKELSDAEPEELKNICIYDSTDLSIHPVLKTVFEPIQSDIKNSKINDDEEEVNLFQEDEIKVEKTDEVEYYNSKKVVLNKDNNSVSYKNHNNIEAVNKRDKTNSGNIKVDAIDNDKTYSYSRKEDVNPRSYNHENENGEYRSKSYGVDENNNEIRYSENEERHLTNGDDFERKGRPIVDKQHQELHRLHQTQQQPQQQNIQNQQQPQQQNIQNQQQSQQQTIQYQQEKSQHQPRSPTQKHNQSNLKYKEDYVDARRVPSGELMLNGKHLPSIDANNNQNLIVKENNNDDVLFQSNNNYKYEVIKMNTNNNDDYNHNKPSISNTSHNSNYGNKYNKYDNSNNNDVYINDQQHQQYSPTNIQTSSNYNVKYTKNQDAIDETNTNPLYGNNKSLTQQQTINIQSLPVLFSDETNSRGTDSVNIKINVEDSYINEDKYIKINTNKTGQNNRLDYPQDKMRSKSLQRPVYDVDSNKDSPRFKTEKQYISADQREEYETHPSELRNRQASNLLLTDDKYLESPKQKNISYSDTDKIISFNSKKKINNKKHLPDITYRASNMDNYSNDEAAYSKELRSEHVYDRAVSSQRHPKLNSPVFKDKFSQRRKDEELLNKNEDSYEGVYEKRTNPNHHQDKSFRQELNPQTTLPPLHLEIPSQQHHKQHRQQDISQRGRNSDMVFEDEDNEINIEHNGPYDHIIDSNNLPLKKWPGKSEKKPEKQNKMYLMDLNGNLSSTSRPSRYITREEDLAMTRDGQSSTKYQPNYNHNSSNNLHSNYRHQDRYYVEHASLGRNSRQPVRSSLDLEFPIKIQAKQQHIKLPQASNTRHLSDIPLYNSRDYDPYAANNRRSSDNNNIAYSSYNFKSNPSHYNNNGHQNSRIYSNGSHTYGNKNSLRNNDIYRNSNYNNSQTFHYLKHQPNVLASASRTFH